MGSRRSIILSWSRKVRRSERCGNRDRRASSLERLTHSEAQSTLPKCQLLLQSKLLAEGAALFLKGNVAGHFLRLDRAKAESQPQLFYWFASWTNQPSSDYLAQSLDSTLKMNMKGALHIASPKFFLHPWTGLGDRTVLLHASYVQFHPQAWNNLLLSPSSGCTLCPSLAILHVLLNPVHQFLFMKTKPLYLNQSTPFSWSGMVWIRYDELKGNLRKIKKNNFGG